MSAILASGRGVPLRVTVNGGLCEKDAGTGSATAQYLIDNDGFERDQDANVLGQWLNKAALNANYWVLATVTSGSGFGGTLSTWLRLNTSRNWFLFQSGPGDNTGTLSIEISTDSGGAVIVATGSVTITAHVGL